MLVAHFYNIYSYIAYDITHGYSFNYIISWYMGLWRLLVWCRVVRCASVWRNVVPGQIVYYGE